MSEYVLILGDSRWNYFQNNIITNNLIVCQIYFLFVFSRRESFGQFIFFLFGVSTIDFLWGFYFFLQELLVKVRDFELFFWQKAIDIENSETYLLVIFSPNRV